MGASLSTLRGGSAKTALAAAVLFYLYREWKRASRSNSRSSKKQGGGGMKRVGSKRELSQSNLKAMVREIEAKKKERRKKNKVTSKFYGTLKRILLSTCGKREAVTAVALCSTLMLRTVLSVWIANHLGTVLDHLCNQRWSQFNWQVGKFAGVTVGGAFLNAFLKYFIAKLQQQVRGKITAHAHKLYMRASGEDRPMMFYKANKVGDDKLENADQLITDDVEKFSDQLVSILSQVLKPCADFFVFSIEMMTKQGLGGPLGLYTWFGIATCICIGVLPPYGRLAATKQALEGRFRAAHADLITNCEQIAFMGGEAAEKQGLDDSYGDIRSHARKSRKLKFTSDIVQGYVNKYFASVVGIYLIARPIWINHNDMAKYKPVQIANYYVSISRIMTGLSESILALFEMGSQIGKLAGLTKRVDTLLSGLSVREPILEKQIALHAESNPPSKALAPEGKETLQFDNVWVYKPDGMLLLRDLNLKVNPGERVIITGPNGCGKSSLFRVLRGLWPLVAGKITKPADKEIYFLSQVNFVPQGTLRELIIYPHADPGADDGLDELAKANAREAIRMGDQHLRRCLKWAHLDDLECQGKRVESFETVLEWTTALSPGQKQRMAFARLFYHCPKYAVLDECTNGVSPNEEADLYNRCKKLGMAVFSISHKNELKPLHDRELHFCSKDEAKELGLPESGAYVLRSTKGQKYTNEILQRTKTLDEEDAVSSGVVG